MTGLTLTLAGVVLLAGLTVGVLGFYDSFSRRRQKPAPPPRLSRAQRRVAATQAWERGDPEATEVIEAVRDELDR